MLSVKLKLTTQVAKFCANYERLLTTANHGEIFRNFMLKIRLM